MTKRIWKQCVFDKIFIYNEKNNIVSLIIVILIVTQLVNKKKSQLT